MDNEQEQPTPPPGVIVASNGAWKDAKTGRFVPGGQPDNMITVANTADYYRLRKQKQMEGLVLADRRLIDISPDYWGDLAEAMYRMAGNQKSAVAAVQATRMVGEMTGYLGSNGKDSDPVPAAGARLELGPDALSTLLEFISSQRQVDSPQAGAVLTASTGRAGAAEESEDS